MNIADFPWSLHNILPFWSGAEHHDFHHMAFVNNFSTSFRWWDRVAGTDKKYLAYRARINAAKKSGLSLDEMRQLEEKLNAQAEKEGVEAEKVAENLTWGKKKTA